MAKSAPSNAAPARGNMILTAILWGTTLFLGYNLWFNKPKDTRTLESLQATMQQQARDLKDASIVATKGAYEGKLNELVGEKKLSQLEADDRKIAAEVLVADTQYRGGLMKDESARIRNAYNTLQGLERKHQAEPAWTTVARAVPLTDGKTSTTGAELFGKISETLSTRNRHDKIWGVIPGGYTLIDGLVHLTGAIPGLSYAFAAFLLALCVRAIVFPLSQKQLMHSRQMMQLAPLAKQIKDEYKDDQVAMQQKTMAMYKEYGINPMGGCAPALVQTPLFLTVYQCMLLYQFEFQKGTFLWINPKLSQLTHGFLAPNLGRQDYPLIVIYGVTMLISSLLTPVSDPTQAKQQRLMGVGVALIFTFFMLTGAFPVVAGFVLYWTFTNLFSMAQSLRAYRLPLPPLKKVNGPHGSVLPVDPASLRPLTAGGNGKPAQHRPKKKAR